jgi:hypothetical protein
VVPVNCIEYVWDTGDRGWFGFFILPSSIRQHIPSLSRQDKLIGDLHVNRQGATNRFLLIISNRQIICLYLAEKEICRQKDTAKVKNQTNLVRQCPILNWYY